jgi:hypothetical protein
MENKKQHEEYEGVVTGIVDKEKNTLYYFGDEESEIIFSKYGVREEGIRIGDRIRFDYIVNGKFKNIQRMSKVDKKSFVSEAVEMARKSMSEIDDAFINPKVLKLVEPVKKKSLLIKVIHCEIRDYEKLHNDFAKDHHVVATTINLDGDSVLCSVIFYE